jgi:hypothetical protein
MNERKKSVNNSPPVHSIVCGNVKADIYACQTNNGYRFLQFCLGRFFTSQSSQKESHSNFFFVENRDEIIRAVQDASAWIREQSNVVLTSEQPTDANPTIVVSNYKKDYQNEKES